MTNDGSTGAYTNVAYDWTYNLDSDFHVLTLALLSNTVKMYVDYKEKLSATYITSPGYVTLNIAAGSNSIGIYDDLKVRKYASPEPTLTLGTEQPTTTPTPTTPTPTTPTPTTPAPTTPTPTTPTPTTPPPPTTTAPSPAAKLPMITISQTSLKEEPEVGEEVIITVTVMNSGDGTAKNIRLTEQIPSSISVSFVDGADKPGSFVIWNGELEPNRAHSITHTLRILEEKGRAIPVTVKYDDAQGNTKETSTTVYVDAQAPEPPVTPTPVGPMAKVPDLTPNIVVVTPPKTPGFSAPLLLIGLLAAVVLVRRR